MSYKEYKEVKGPWTVLGDSPLEDVPVARANLRWRIEADGFRTWEGERAWYFNSLEVDLVPVDGSPEGMVRIPSGAVDLAGETVELPAFWLDQHEVTLSGEGPAPVASFPGLGSFGTYDMAGNVKEWTWNAMGDFAGEVPVSDEVYVALSSPFSYDRVPLDARTERIDDQDTRWLIETVSFEVGPGEPRMLAHVYVPRHAPPPFEAIVYFPGSSALGLTSSENLAEQAFFEFLPASGRLFVHPVYEGTYERGGTVGTSGVAGRRDRIITWAREVSRVVDYLEEREDVAGDRVALFGLSLGAMYAPIFSAVEPRLAAAVFLGGGLNLRMLREAPEANPLNFASRVKTPTLMIAGRNDVIRPPETAQRPVFDLIDVAEADKRFVVLDGGHIPDFNEVIRETLDWLDRHLGSIAEPSG